MIIIITELVGNQVAARCDQHHAQDGSRAAAISAVLTKLAREDASNIGKPFTAPEAGISGTVPPLPKRKRPIARRRKPARLV